MLGSISASARHMPTEDPEDVARKKAKLEAHREPYVLFKGKDFRQGKNSGWFWQAKTGKWHYSAAGHYRCIARRVPKATEFVYKVDVDDLYGPVCSLCAREARDLKKQVPVDPASSEQLKNLDPLAYYRARYEERVRRLEAEGEDE